MYGQPQFDRHQFANRRTKAVTADYRGHGEWDTPGISFGDLGQMHILRPEGQQERRLPTPLWSQNDEALRAVVLRYAEDRLYLRDHSGTDAERMARITAAEQKYLSTFKEHLQELLLRFHQNPENPRHVQNKDSEIRLLERGIVTMVIAIAYRYYREGHHSVQVAQEFDLKSPGVRKLLYALNTVANRLGFQEGPVFRNRHEGRQQPKNSIYYTKENALELFALRNAGTTWLECSDALKLSSDKIAKQIWQHYFGDLKVNPVRPKRSRRTVWTDEKLAELKWLRGIGVSFRQIADVLGIVGKYAGHSVRRTYMNQMFGQFMKT